MAGAAVAIRLELHRNITVTVNSDCEVAVASYVETGSGTRPDIDRLPDQLCLHPRPDSRDQRPPAVAGLLNLEIFGAVESGGVRKAAYR